MPRRLKSRRMVRDTIKRIVFHIVYPFCYRLGCLKTVKKKKAVFVQTHGERLSDNFELLYQSLQQRGYETLLFCLRVSDSGWIRIIARSIRLLFAMADAGVILVDESNSLMGSFRLRRNSRMIQLWHACGAFKKWGFSVADKSFGDDEKNLKAYSGHGNYSLVTVSGQEVCWAYEEAFGLEPGGGIVRPVGVSRTDVFFDEKKRAAAVAKLHTFIPEAEGRKVIVYLPTFRGDIAGAKAPEGFDIGRLKELEQEYMILIRNHPFVKEAVRIPAECAGFVREIRDGMSVEELIMTADLMITDYSSVVFEYSLMNRPMIFYAYDMEQYDLERGFYYPYREFVPGRIAVTMEELIQAIREADNYDYDKLAAFRSRYMSGCDGHATERITEFIEQ